VETSDAVLVAHSLNGDRDAFGQIVTRYQSLVCSLAYSSTGSLTQSEDLAQQTFVTAWTQLSGLREPEKLLSWLCSIVRNLSHRAWRGHRLEPVHGAEPLEILDKMPAPGPHPLEQTINREEESILWRQLEGIPETYRLPLILYYRQHESVEQVALALELSADTVRQRLVRGRKLLHERVLAFVEGTLGKTAPGQRFTNGVLAALPVVATSAKATATGTTIAAGGAVAKGALATVGSLGGLLAMLGGALVSGRAMAGDFKSPRERRFVVPIAAIQGAVGLLFIAAVLEWQWEYGKPQIPHGLFVRDSLRSALFFSLIVLSVGLWSYRRSRQRLIQIEEKTFAEAEWDSPGRKADFEANSSGTELDPAAKKINHMPLSRWLKLSALSLVWLALSAFQAPWKHHFALALSCSAMVPLLALLLLWRRSRHRPRFQFPPLLFLLPIAALITLVSADIDFVKARAAADMDNVPSPTQIISLNAAVIVAYAVLGWILAERLARLKLHRQAP
jgi:RNA polymerase sigma factor (sigma-70 family)